ncbi:histidine phosphatase family protein [Terriglobus albidus]|uniref:histidine phosphatase family protein n=1 Tax=Terriglobus albidus TaxID=1592106 RepID=UPI0021DFB911|nr:histidine phosphatase family protein [Terriglobus albidus]
MSHLVFVRHAETDMAGKFCGHSDPSINEAGRKQVLDLISHLGDKQKFDAIYSSDLRRALDTATPIAAAFHLPLHKDSTLREIYFGDWEGLTWKEIEERDPDYAHKWLKCFPSMPSPNGELFAAFEDRVMQAVRCLRDGEPDRKAVVVTHAGIMRLVLCGLLGCGQQEAYEITREYCCSFELGDAATTREVVR